MQNAESPFPKAHQCSLLPNRLSDMQVVRCFLILPSLMAFWGVSMLPALLQWREKKYLNLNFCIFDSNTAQTVLSTPNVTRVKPPNEPMSNFSSILTSSQASSLSLTVIPIVAYRKVTRNLDLESYLAITHS